MGNRALPGGGGPTTSGGPPRSTERDCEGPQQLSLPGGPERHQARIQDFLKGGGGGDGHKGGGVIGGDRPCRRKITI